MQWRQRGDPSPAPFLHGDTMVRLALNKLAEEWLLVRQACPENVRFCLQAIVQTNNHALATYFYDEMLRDPMGMVFLTHDQVKTRLHASMVKWVTDLFAEPFDDPLASIAIQQKIGDVHARVGVPLHIVLRGARALKTCFYGLIRQHNELSSLEMVDAVCLVDGLINSALEVMGSGYAVAHDRRARAEGSYRLFSVIQNVEAEKERQRAALFTWENRILYELASGAMPQALPRLTASEFGLWFRHKGAHAFQGSSEIDHINRAIETIDHELDVLAQRKERFPAEAGNASLFRVLREKSEEIRYNLNRLFDQSSTLESGRDALTRMLSRKFLPVVMRKELEYARETQTRFAMLVVDIDYFKSVNDTYGHDAGDVVLQHFANLLSSVSRAGDYVFRTGGEEFLLLLVDITEDAALRVAETLRKRVEQEPFSIGGDVSLHLTVSVGVAVYNGHPDYEQTMRRADQAVYRAKQSGRNRIVMVDDA